jgi:hypothetical protein
MAELLKPKVSIIMQCLLADYPGSRENSIFKFKRAVKSFKNQIYKNCELIIVADNCELTKKIFQENYTDEDNIKFIFYHRSSKQKKMYEKNNEGERIYRGFARQIGRGAVDGELTTYMDSDDILSPKFTFNIVLEYNRRSDLDWWINRSWYDNYKSNWPDTYNMYSTIGAEEIELDYIESKWNRIKMKDHFFVMSPWLLTHRSECDIKWRDISGKISEDSDFSMRLREKYKKGGGYDNPSYVRCHYTDRWDI